MWDQGKGSQAEKKKTKMIETEIPDRESGWAKKEGVWFQKYFG